MKIALIHHSTQNVVNQATDKVVQSHSGTMPSLALLYVAATFEREGCEVLYIDEVAMGVSRDDIRHQLVDFAPDFVGITVYTSHFHDARTFCRFVKQAVPTTKVIVGGIHMTIYPTESLKYAPEIDFACVGEAEMVMPEFLARWRKGQSFEGLAGLVWRDGEEIRFAGAAPSNENLDTTPFPARHLVPNERYFTLISKRKNFTALNTSRGCPFACVFCEGARTKWRFRTAKNIADEFQETYEKYGVREIDIYDSSFTIKKERVYALCEELTRRGLDKKMLWAARSRVDCVDEPLLKAMYEAGCYRMFYGIESGVPEILRALNKQANVEMIREVVTASDSIGISVLGYFLVGSPHETLETFRQTLDFAKSLPLDFVTFNALSPLPRTQLYRDYYLPNTNFDFWENYIRLPEPPTESIGRPWMSLDDATVKGLCRQAVMEFYFRPSQVLRLLRNVGSPSHFWRLTRAATAIAVSSLSRDGASGSVAANAH